jgi:glyoxylase-like metal-dependent hydrolase (beta-lactamase superfamily II)
MLQWKIGGVTITSVAELADMPIPGPEVIPLATPEAVLAIDWLRPDFADDAGNVKLRIQALVVESAGRRIIVDTCLGNDKTRTKAYFSNLTTPFLTDLGAAGFPPESIDAVICTHLHVDHIGWNTVWRENSWIPTFPNARYFFSRVDVDYWSRTPSIDGEIFQDSVQPVLDAGLADLVDPPFAVTDEVALIPTPGHSPGHLSVRIRSGDDHAVITGDLMHHPVQMAEVDWYSQFDEDAAHAARTRREFLAEYTDTDVLVIGTHFATPGAGRVVRDGDAYRLLTESGRR